jgi:hypothetical protein
VKEIPLTKGHVALVDDEDYEELSKHKWCCSRGYAVRKNGKAIELMHRRIMQPPSEMTVDHINGNRADNRRENLRICTFKQNLSNRVKKPNCTSQFRGVTRARGGKWKVQVHTGDRVLYFGLYESEYEAARIYDAVAPLYLGPFVRKNFPVETYTFERARTSTWADHQ